MRTGRRSSAPQQVSRGLGMDKDVTYLYKTWLMRRVNPKSSIPDSLPQLKSQSIPCTGFHLLDQAGFFGIASCAKRKHLHPNLRRSRHARFAPGCSRKVAQKVFQMRSVDEVVAANLFANGRGTGKKKFR